MAAQMLNPRYKAAPQTSVLFIKTADTFNHTVGVIAVRAKAPDIEVGGTFSKVIRGA